MEKLLFLATAPLALLLSNTVGVGQPVNVTTGPNPIFVATGDTQDLVGSWVGGAGDGGAAYVVELELHADGTYKKTLTAKTNNADGSHSGYGGSHSGTWKAKGSVVYLSGDGNWPPYSHDLSKFRKVR